MVHQANWRILLYQASSRRRRSCRPCNTPASFQGSMHVRYRVTACHRISFVYGRFTFHLWTPRVVNGGQIVKLKICSTCGCTTRQRSCSGLQVGETCRWLKSHGPVFLLEFRAPLYRSNISDFVASIFTEVSGRITDFLYFL